MIDDQARGDLERTVLTEIRRRGSTRHRSRVAVVLWLGLGACSESSTSPPPDLRPDRAADQRAQDRLTSELRPAPDAPVPDRSPADLPPADLPPADLQAADAGSGEPGPFEGFGRNATGGKGGQTVVVTTAADSGPGSLRELLAAASGPTTVRFQGNLTISLATTLQLPSNLTLDGRGQTVTIRNKGLIVDGKSHIILHNLAFEDILGPEDAIMIANGSHDLVIDHCRFSNAGLKPTQTDEQISIIFGSREITISYCRFEAHEKVLLFGNGDAPATVDSQITVTLHHNHFYKTGRRHPYLRYGKVDMYNNYLQEWQLYQGLQLCGSGGIILPCSYGVRSANSGQVLLEANFFEQHDLVLHTLGGHGAVVELGGMIQSLGNQTLESWISLAQTGTVFARPYPATVETISPGWAQQLAAKAGNVL